MTKIYYFSGTGNSLWSAKKIAELTGKQCELYNIGVEAEKTNVVIEADAVVFVFPSYGYGLPLIVGRFIKNAVFKTEYAAFFVTYGSSPKGTLGILARILKKKGIAKLYFGKIPSVENYLALFGPPKEKTMQTRLLMQEKASEEAARAVAERRENRVCKITPFSCFVSRLFSLGVKVFYKKYKLSSDCNGCGICKKVCPVDAIVMESGRPVLTAKCEHCQGCVNMCPQRAIQFGRVKFGTPGYRHPQIDISDLVR